MPRPVEPSLWRMNQNGGTHLTVSLQEKWECHHCLPQVKTLSLGLGGTSDFVSKGEGRNDGRWTGSQQSLPQGPLWCPYWYPVPSMREWPSSLSSTPRVMAWSLELASSTSDRGLDLDLGTLQCLPCLAPSTVLNVPSPERPGIEKSGPRGSSHCEILSDNGGFKPARPDLSFCAPWVVERTSILQTGTCQMPWIYWQYIDENWMPINYIVPRAQEAPCLPACESKTPVYLYQGQLILSSSIN